MTTYNSFIPPTPPSIVDDDNFFDHVSDDSSVATGSDTNSVTSHLKGDFDIIQQLIRDSDLYKRAYELFSSDVQYGGVYLELLQAIPESYVVRDENFWDRVSNSLGGTSGYENLLIDSLTAAFDEIRALMQSYQSFKNSLPVEQVNQLAQAGINASVTGQGITSSSLPTEGLVTDSPSLASGAYSNKSVSEGITSFVNFIGQLGSVVSGGFSSANLMGLLDIAERDAYNKQELHDLLLAESGVTNPSPYRVLSPSNTPIVSSKSDKANADQRVATVVSKANASTLDTKISVPTTMGDEGEPQFALMSGEDILYSVSRFNMGLMSAEAAIKYIDMSYQSAYADMLGRLNQENKVADVRAGIAEGEFNADYFNARDGIGEGVAASDLAKFTADMQSYKSTIAQIQSYVDDMKYQQMAQWAEGISERPYLAPYLYKAMFDFNMSDTFWNQSGVHQYVNHGLDTADKLLGIAGSFFGLKPKKLVPRTTRTHSKTSRSKGVTETFTETISE